MLRLIFSQVINMGESMQMLSGGYYKAAIQRVVQPPTDQRGCDRIGVFYFATANNDIKLAPVKESPVIQQAGVMGQCGDEDAPTMDQWLRARTRAYAGQTNVLSQGGEDVREEILKGFYTTHYA